MGKILQNHFVLAVHDLQKSAEFFQALGFEVVAEPHGWRFLSRDNCMVMLGHCPGTLSPRELGDHSYFGYLRVDDVDRFHAEVRSRGVIPLSAPETKEWEMREFSVMSPEGHRLMIGQWVGKPR
jgi:catechol 2,3-dioxygenase-like lactoylglutathione lyase family enzyme